MEDDKPVVCSRDVVIKPDVALADVADNLYDVVILPGGREGGPKLAESELVKKVVIKHYKDYRTVATICHSALVFLKAEIGFGRKLTSYPTSKDKLDEYFTYIEDQPVVVDENMITSRGPGTAFDFAFAVAEKLMGADVVKLEKERMLIKN